MADWTLPWPEERARIVLAELAEIPEPVDDDWWMLTVETLDDGRLVGDVCLMRDADATLSDQLRRYGLRAPEVHVDDHHCGARLAQRVVVA